ncbi:Sepiapterin reductase [Trichuris trichiura]|uniref:Sepiapterin reductase n=1 Tax=Trichuris trichiura TaxID=36087 RepID=A0A077ZIK5_TRITR|nr:Sepiapterin reductase [Trichuris trichiura]
MTLLGKKTLCVITGASRGIGKAISLKLVSHLGPKSHVILLARDQKALEVVRVEALSKATDVSISILPLDLSNVNKELYHTALNRAIEETCTARFDLALLIQNAATVGPIDLPALQLTNVDLVRDYFDLNVTSFIIFNNVFFALCDEHFAKERVAVNISSGASYLSIPSLHLYSAGKAARDAFYRCFAAEETGIRVLNFNPGPVSTDMQMEIFQKTHSTKIKEWSKDGMDKSTFATSEFVAEKFVDCLKRNDFESGAFCTAENQQV